MGKGEETRQQIVASALALASEIGLGAISIGALAERVGMSKSGLFAHFASKENLQVAILDDAIDRFVRVVVAPALKQARGEPRVRAMIDGWMRWLDQDFMPGGCVFMAAAVELDDQPGPARDRLLASQRDWIETLEQAIRIAIEERHFRSDLDPAQLSFEIFGVMESYHFRRRLLAAPDSAQRARTAFDRLLKDAASTARPLTGAAARPRRR